MKKCQGLPKAAKVPRTSQSGKSAWYFVLALVVFAVGYAALRAERPSAAGPVGAGAGAADAGLYCGFEELKPWDISPEQGFALSLSSEHVTQGEHSLKVVFPPAEWPSINTKKLPQPVREFEALTLDVFNPQPEPVPFAVRLDDRERKKVTIDYPLQPGQNRVHIPQERLQQKLDPSKLFFLVLFLSQPGKEVTLYFDNLRLVPRGGSAVSDTKPALVSDTALHAPKRAKPQPALPIPPPVPEPAPQTSGSLDVTVVRLRGEAGTPALVSNGVPFAPGQLASERDVAILRDGQELPAATQVLARWPKDGSIRSLLLQFHLQALGHEAPVTFAWGRTRQAADVSVVPVTWEAPEGFLALPAYWLCDSQVIGPQVPMGGHPFPDYDAQIQQYYPLRRDDQLQGDIRTDGYYSTPHAFYQLYVRSGDPDIFLSARKELLAYREREIIHEGPDAGRHVTYAQTRYVYTEAMADDYFLTGDPRTLEVAKTMAGYQTRVFPPSKAFYPGGATNFFTEREAASPLLGVVSYYEMSGEDRYLQLAKQYVDNLYRTQQEWPERGGFIHNLYAHDTEEGARPDEYGGSPFMTGLLLEGIIRYHQLTGDETAARSIFMALDWLMNEGLAPDGSSFLYLTSDNYRSEPGQPDLNMLVAHGFGYGYKLSGYARTDYLELGTRLFQRGIQDAFLGKRKHFNQNFRSSGHFLAYIAQQTTATGELRPIGELLYQGDFEHGADGWAQASEGTVLELDAAEAFSGRRSLKARRETAGTELAVGKTMPGWYLDEHPLLRLAYKAPQGTSLGVRCQTNYNDWVTLGEEAPRGPATNVGGGAGGAPAPAIVTGGPGFALAGDGGWHEVTLDVREAIHRVLPGVGELTGCHVFTRHAAPAGSAFWLDSVHIRKQEGP